MKQIEKIILGTAQLGMKYGINNSEGMPSLGNSMKLLSFAFDQGIRILDTAEGYGKSLTRIGEFHKFNPKKKFKVISKISSKSFGFDKDKVFSLTKESLQKLQLDNFEAVLLHRFDDIKEYPELIREIIELKKKGLLKNIGCSIYDLPELESLLNHEFVDIIQIPVNLLDRRFIQADLLRKMKNSGKRFHARSVFLQGLLFKPPEELPIKLRDLESSLSRLNNLSQNAQLSISELALSFVSSIEEIEGLIIGVDSIEQLRINIQELKKSLNPKIIEEINQITVQNPELLDPRKW